MSTGPRTPAGKSRSRANSYKHGLTGAGIVLPDEDARELDRRYQTMVEEMRPNTEVATQLLKRFAVMTVKLDRGDLHEAKAIAHRMRKAVAEYDDARLAAVENLYSWIAAEPATNARRLRSSPEGIDRLISAIEGLKSDLGYPGSTRWNWQHCEQLHHLLGMRRMDVPVSRHRALSEAVLAGIFQHLGESDRPELEKLERQCWAASQLVLLIDEEIAKLKGLRAGFDLEALALDRAEAPIRAMFDDSKEGVLARKYNASNERAMFRTLRDFNELQANTSEVEIKKAIASEPAGELGSFLPGSPSPGDKSPDVDSIVLGVAGSALDGVPNASPDRLSRRDRPDFDPLQVE